MHRGSFLIKERGAAVATGFAPCWPRGRAHHESFPPPLPEDAVDRYAALTGGIEAALRCCRHTGSSQRPWRRGGAGTGTDSVPPRASCRHQLSRRRPLVSGDMSPSTAWAGRRAPATDARGGSGAFCTVRACSSNPARSNALYATRLADVTIIPINIHAGGQNVRDISFGAAGASCGAVCGLVDASRMILIDPSQSLSAT